MIKCLQNNRSLYVLRMDLAFGLGWRVQPLDGVPETLRARTELGPRVVQRPRPGQLGEQTLFALACARLRPSRISNVKAYTKRYSGAQLLDSPCLTSPFETRLVKKQTVIYSAYKSYGLLSEAAV